MASGEMRPDSNTDDPSRVTSRSSCSVFKRCDTTRAIFRRQELDPTSIAAKVGMGPRYTTAARPSLHPDRYNQVVPASLRGTPEPATAAKPGWYPELCTLFHHDQHSGRSNQAAPGDFHAGCVDASG